MNNITNITNIFPYTVDTIHVAFCCFLLPFSYYYIFYFLCIPHNSNKLVILVIFLIIIIKIRYLQKSYNWK